MKIIWKREWLSVAMLATMFVLAAIAWPSAPDAVPVHWGWSGQPDRFGGRVEGLFGVPSAALGVYVLLLFVPRIDPRRVNYDAFAWPYTVLRTVVVGLLFALDAVVLSWARGQTPSVNGVIAVAGGVALMLTGNYLPKVKPNWFVGIRTPWTLSSDESWRRTHRLAGWLLTASGIITVVAELARPDLGRATLLGTLITAFLVSVVYSYFAWRNDPYRATASSSHG